ncbi:MAG: hypothetical protein EKK57_07230 [Proteobacteria bacterium]|nr:MAG: hypothetical protein EKK57_07230 [Pseudomonadota bacterium]
MKLISTTTITRKRYEVELWSGNAKKLHYVVIEYAANGQRIGAIIKDYYGNDVTSDSNLIRQLADNPEFMKLP